MLRQLIIIGVTLLSGSDFVSSHLEITDREANPYDHLLWPKVATVDLGERIIITVYIIYRWREGINTWIRYYISVEVGWVGPRSQKLYGGGGGGGGGRSTC